MRFYGNERRRGSWIKWVILIPIAVVAGVFVFGSVVMLLWNNILPTVFGISAITFWQALGILVLAKILFGGFTGGHRCRCHGRGHDLAGRWMQMTPEEREKMKSEWRGWCEPSVKQE